MPSNRYFPVLSHMLPKDDPRYVKWHENLKKRPAPWCTGKTKETDSSVRKISETFKRKKIDNFKEWRVEAKRTGKIPNSYPAFKKDESLAFLIGLVLGDGHIDKFPRTEKLSIALGTDKPDLISFTVPVVEKVFNKTPVVSKAKESNMVRINLYQKYISKRLGVPSGNKGRAVIAIPGWIYRSKKYSLAYLRGLYEAEASLCIHLPTCTYNFAFTNRNPSLLGNVNFLLRRLKLHPEVRSVAIRLRRKKEVKYFESLINFRNYNAGLSNGSLVAL